MGYGAWIGSRGGDIAGEEFYGVIGSDFVDSSIPNGIWATLTERNTGLPPALVVVGATGDGALFVLDTACRVASGECPVGIWRTGQRDSDELEHVADDFGEFFKRRIEQAVLA